jgi:signal transduction histidine kinase
MDPSQNSFFADFSPAGRDHLAAAARSESFPSGAYLFHEGDAADGIYLVLDGTIEIVRVAGDREEVLSRFVAGEYLGEVAVLDGLGRSTSARALGPVTIAKIAIEPLLEALNSEPLDLTISLFRHSLAHLRQANDLFVSSVVRREKLGLVGEMAGSLMHDLRNPITGICLGADLISMRHNDEETLHACARIRMQCDRLVVMATELLEFSRGESKLHRWETDTVTFLDQFRDLNPGFFQPGKIVVTLEPGKKEPLEIDSLRLVRVLQNLVANAFEAIGTERAGVVKIRSWVENGDLFIEVADDGPGIPEHLRTTIFDPFVTHGKRGGTGLGMSIVRNVVTAHRGTITFTTEKDKGTTFLIRLPQRMAPS